MFSVTRDQRLTLVTAALIGLWMLTGATARLNAQGSTVNASLSGAIYDSSGGAIPGARVTISSAGRGFSRTQLTAADGRFSFASLPPGAYALTVEKAGFTRYHQAGIILNISQEATEDITLRVGEITQAVTVTAGAPLLDTTTANIGTQVTARQLTQLPLNLRNIFYMLFTNSMVNNSAQWQVLSGGSARGIQDGDIGFLNFGGGRFGTTAYLLDGAWDSANDWDAPIWVPGVDETEEMKIQTTTFSAQYGWSTGNVVNVVTKGGTSQFHGDAWEFLRNSAMDANTFFNNASGLARPSFRRNQFGFTFGGPLDIPHVYRQRDKTFFFLSYEGNRESTPATAVDTVPTAAFRTGDFSALLGAPIGNDCLGRPVLSGQLYNPFTTRSVTAGAVDPVTGLKATCTGNLRDPFSGNIIPSGMINQTSAGLSQYWPGATSGGLFSNYAATGPLGVGYDRGNLRIDHNISDKSRMFGRFSIEKEFKTEFPPLFGANDLGGPGAIRGENRGNAALGYTHTFNPTTVLSATAGWGRWIETLVPQGKGFNYTSVGLPSYLNVISPWFPGIGVSGTTGLGSGAGVINPREVRSVEADLTKVHGSHTMMAGVMFVSHQTPNNYQNVPFFGFGADMTQGPDPRAANPQTGWGYASFLLGAGDGGGLTANFGRSMNSNEWYGLYFQDNWRATRKLTLDLGLRYGYQTAPTERFNRNAWFDFTDANPISSAIGFNVPGHIVYQGGGNGNRRGIYQPQANNFAPRIAMAYSVTKNLVMRAGFGIFFTPAMEIGGYQGLDLYGYTQTTPYVGTLDGITPQNLLSNPFPTGLIQPPGKSQGALTNVGLGVDAVAGYRPTPYVEQWSYGLQYQITPNNLIEAAYLGNHGLKLPWGGLAANQINPQNLSMGSALFNSVPNPFYGHIAASACGLNDPTVPQGQLLLPFPEYCGVNLVQNPGASSYYDALQLTFTHRWSQGLQFVASFTGSKYLSQSEGWEGWTYPNAGVVRNYYDLASEKSLDGNDVPKSLVLTYIYQLPVGHGKHFGSTMSRPLDAIAGGWQVTGISTFKDGFPLSIVADANNTGPFGGGQRPNLVGNPHVSNPTLKQ